VAPVLLHHRVDFATSMIDGRTVMEINGESNSAQEVIDIWQYVSRRLGKLERRRRQRPYEGADRRRPIYVPALNKPPERPTFGRRLGLKGIASGGPSSPLAAKDAKVRA
jgi:chromosome partitioning protein